MGIPRFRAFVLGLLVRTDGGMDRRCDLRKREPVHDYRRTLRRVDIDNPAMGQVVIATQRTQLKESCWPQAAPLTTFPCRPDAG